MIRGSKRRRKVLLSALYGTVAAAGLAVVFLVLHASRPEDHPQETPREESDQVPVSDPATESTPPAPEKYSTVDSLRQASIRQAEKTPTTKPARQTPLQIESVSDFDRHVSDAAGICLADMYSDRCPPCRLLAPTISSLAIEYAGKVTVCKVNVDRLPQLARRYGIRAIPTVLIIKNGKLLKTFVGLRPKTEYIAILDKLLNEEQ